MRTAAILPVKRFPAAKQRLRDAVGDEWREQLALAMAGDVLDALAQVSALALIVVVTSEPGVLALADGHGADTVADPGQRGQTAAVALGVEYAIEHGAQRALLVPGDCPALDGGELMAMLAAHAAEREVVIVPDRHGTGTNALLLTPADVIEPAFGPGSCERHRDLAWAAGASMRMARPSSLLLDVDTKSDLQALRERLASVGERPSTGARTRAVLDAMVAASPA